jgi:hypothetical protein
MTFIEPFFKKRQYLKKKQVYHWTREQLGTSFSFALALKKRIREYGEIVE